ncbi:MAG: prepilin-type N-terminal cleavage/methylation domain-containing protein [Deltaproteobacteria bacterium]|nr:prepilin-type N-terminal cleavage/methylation domain-containing protein [Deltaproteobacteria bacterium]
MQKAKCKRQNGRIGRRGFSATEVLLSMIILSIVALAVSPVFFQSVASYALATGRARVMHDARNAIMQMQREMITVTTARITGIQAQQFSFIDDNALAATYQFTPGAPFGTITRGATLVMPNAVNLTFSYFDANGAVTNVIANVRRIGVTIVAAAPNQGNLTLRTEVFPRNFAYTNFQQ